MLQKYKKFQYHVTFVSKIYIKGKHPKKELSVLWRSWSCSQYECRMFTTGYLQDTWGKSERILKWCNCKNAIYAESDIWWTAATATAQMEKVMTVYNKGCISNYRNCSLCYVCYSVLYRMVTYNCYNGFYEVISLHLLRIWFWHHYHCLDSLRWYVPHQCY